MICNNIIFYLLCITHIALCKNTNAPIVETPLGTLEGSLKSSVGGKLFYSFEGIPYARPPTGKHRFKASVPIRPWPGIWKANLIHACMQYSHLGPKNDPIVGDEDCLYLNVYTPKLNQNKKLDVIIFIHGGAFMFGLGGFFGPDILMDENVVYVTINYRLGPLGFLSTEDDIVPGNNGMKDQILALQWIKENIEYFGGNPNSVTISGMSAGGASVHFHYLSPKSRGLFHKGISQSGVMLNSWVLQEKALEKAKKLGSILGCDSQSTMGMIDCLRKRPARRIVQAVRHFQPWLYNPYSPFAIVVDKWASDPVLPEHPYILLKNKQVADLPWIASHTSAEGLYPGVDFYDDEHLNVLNEKFNELMPHILHYNDTVDPVLIDQVGDRIRRHYLKDEIISKKTFKELIDLVGDRLFVADIEKAVRLHNSASISAIYHYNFDYRGAHSLTELRLNCDDNIGVSHGDDTVYVLQTAVNMRSTETDKKMSRVMVDIFITFAKNGKPKIGTTWNPVPKGAKKPFSYIRIKSPENIFMESKEALGERDFWDSLPFHENENLFKTKDEL